jgi:hypothetical protein
MYQRAVFVETETKDIVLQQMLKMASGTQDSEESSTLSLYSA